MIILSLIGLIITLAVVILAVAVAIGISVWLYSEEGSHESNTEKRQKGHRGCDSLYD